MTSRRGAQHDLKTMGYLTTDSAFLIIGVTRTPMLSRSASLIVFAAAQGMRKETVVVQVRGG